MAAEADAMPVRTGRADQTLLKKRRLLQIAREEFIRQGYRAVTMDAIAQAARVSKRSLYLWHEDKAALFRACLVAGTEQFPLPRLSGAPDPKADLCAFAVALLEEFTRPSTVGIARLLMREAHEFTDFWFMIQHSRDRHLVGPLAGYLERAGLTSGGETQRSAMLLLSMILAPVHNHLLLGDPLPDDRACAAHADLAVRTFLEGRRAATVECLDP